MAKSPKRLLAGVLTAVFALAAAGDLEYAREHHQKQTFSGGSRYAAVESTDYYFGTSYSLKLYENREERFSAGEFLFRDNAQEVARSKKDAEDWVNAPDAPPVIPPSGPILF
jgi:hypothetical protein